MTKGKKKKKCKKIANVIALWGVLQIGGYLGSYNRECVTHLQKSWLADSP